MPIATPKAVALLALTLTAAAPATPPSLLVASQGFLVYGEGDRRQAAVASGGGFAYRLLGTISDGTALAAFDLGSQTIVETISPALATRTIKTFPAGTRLFRGNEGFIAYEGTSQLARRYDSNGNLVGTPIAALGVAELLGVADSVVGLGNGRLRIWDRNGRMQREALMEGNSLVPLADGRFAVNDIRDSEVRAYTTTLEQTATLRYVGLPARALASAPDGTLAVLAGTPTCTQSNAEVDVFTDLHAQPTARIRDNITSASRLALGNDYVFVAISPCQSGQEGAIAVFTRDGTSQGIMHNVGTPTDLLPFTVKR
jgi:hypothetical protein